VRKLIYSMMVSVDGFIARPDGQLDWVLVDEELHSFVNDQVRDLGAFLYGRRLWEAMAIYWPTADQEVDAPPYIVDFARIWQAMPKVVFSKTLEGVDGDTRLVRTDAGAEIARLKAEPGKDLAIGGAELAASAMRLGLIDEVQLFVHQAVLGGGKPMFATAEPPMDLRLVDTRRFASGVVYLAYERRDPQRQG
jgi:dihydrofolate reductase